MRLFPIKKKFVYRHKMLEYLYSKLKDQPLHKTDLLKSKSSFTDIAQALNIDAARLKEYHHAFHRFPKGEDHVQCFNNNNEYFIGIEEPGIQAYLDQFWINEGEKDLNERIYDKTKWIVPVFALVVTAFSLWYSITTLKQTQTKVERLEKRLLNLEREPRQKVEYIKKSLPQVHDSLKKK